MRSSNFSPFLIELFLVDETDCGNFLLLKGGKKFGGHGDDFGARHGAGGGGKVVNGDRDLAIDGGGSLLPGTGNALATVRRGWRR